MHVRAVVAAYIVAHAAAFFGSLPTLQCSNFQLAATAHNEQDATPLVDMLVTAAKRVKAPMFFPGHKLGAGTPSVFINKLLHGNSAALLHDLPELPELDNLFAPTGVIRDAETLAAKCFGSARTWLLANGSTSGVQALIMAIVQRHRSFSTNGSSRSSDSIIILVRYAPLVCSGSQRLAGCELVCLHPSMPSVTAVILQRSRAMHTKVLCKH
jgi:Orn/Lys/Arg decarboxylase, major domain